MVRLPFLIFLLSLVVFSCNSEKRLKITGGSIDYITYGRINDSEIQIEYFDKQDTIFGICVQLDVELYSSNEESKRVQYYGPGDGDKIKSISGWLEKNNRIEGEIDLNRIFYNDSSLNSMKLPEGLMRATRSIGSNPDKGLVFSTVYEGFSSFENSFNDTTNTLYQSTLSAWELRTPIFFWTKNRELISQINEGVKLVLEFEFSNGSKIQLE